MVNNIEAVFRKYMFKIHNKNKAQILYNIIYDNSKTLFKGKIHELMVKN